MIENCIFNTKNSTSIYLVELFFFFFFSGLVVDQFSQRLFWADFELSVIGSVLFDGSDSVVSVSTKQGMKRI